MDILVIGGTRYFGLAAVEQLLEAGHKVSIFSRGNVRPPFWKDIEHIEGDREDAEGMAQRPAGRHFDEMPISVARMMLYNETCGTPIGRYAEVACAAKKPLPAGTVLDGEGGYCTYGLLEKTAVAREENLLPLGLSQDAVVTRGIPEDGMVRWDDVTLPDSEVLELWEQQENNL